MYTDAQRRAHIYDVQRFLRRIMRDSAHPQPLVPDGVYGAETAAAVREFQRRNDLAVTGTVNYDTWTLLYSRYTELTLCDELPDMISFYPACADAKITANDKGPSVLVLQLMLNTAAPHFSDVTPVTLTGIYDEETMRTVRLAQQTFQLPPTGITDRATWDALALFHNSFYYRTPLPWLLADN